MSPLAVWWTLLPVRVPAPPPGAERGEEFGKSSPIALVVILLLGLATVLLIRSMTKRLRNVPESFDPPSDQGPGGTGDTDGGPSSTSPGRSPGRNGMDRTDGPPGTGSP